MKLTLKKADAVIRTAKLNGFGGNCGRVAVAINHVLFDGQGKYVVATNPPLNTKTGDFFMGHVAVEWRGRLFDASGLITDEETFEAWGMLDYQDSDLPVRLTEDEAQQGELHYIDDVFGDQRDQEDAIENFTRGQCPLRDVYKALEVALSRAPKTR